MSECHLPLFDFIERMREPGRKMAQEMYHCRGFVCHHSTDIWGDAAPQDLCKTATIWPMGAAWLCLHIFEHYAFTQDLDFLEQHYAAMREAALFFVDYLTEDETGALVTGPSVSPENTYRTEQGGKGSLCMGPTMDMEIVTVLFQTVIKSAALLEKDAAFSEQLQGLLAKLPKLKIGKYGQIQEWAKDYDEVEVGHPYFPFVCPAPSQPDYTEPYSGTCQCGTGYAHSAADSWWQLYRLELCLGHQHVGKIAGWRNGI